MSEMMACEKMNARIPVATCLGRQTKGINISGKNESSIYSVPYECRDCEAGRSALESGQKEEESMAAKRACRNCGRVMSIVGDGCCFTCYHEGKGLEGEKMAAALASIKAKIDSGGIGVGKRRSLSGKAAPADPASRRELRGLAENAMHDEIRGIKGKTTAQVIAEMLPADIPVTIRLMMEISIRVSSIAF